MTPELARFREGKTSILKRRLLCPHCVGTGGNVPIRAICEVIDDVIAAAQLAIKLL
jgi:hypothetical protein